MRIHVTYQGKKTTVSVENILIDYFAAWLAEDYPDSHANAKAQLIAATEGVQRYVEGLTPSPSKDTLSSRVQEMIIHKIAKPGLGAIVQMRGHLQTPRKKKYKVPQEWIDKYSEAWVAESSPKSSS